MPSLAEAELDLTGARSPIPREGYAYWRSRLRGRLFPARGDFDPLVEVPQLARHILLFDVLHDPLDFRYRLIGDRLREHMGANWTGRRWSEIAFQRPPNPIFDEHKWVVENRRPRYYRPNYVGPDHDFLYLESVVLPLGDDPERVDMLMVFADFISRNRL